MMDEIHSLLAQLHDIEGIDAVSPWPLAIGWWVVIVLLLLALFVVGWLVSRRVVFIYSWKYDTLQKLGELEHSLSKKFTEEIPQRETIILFSEYLRRIAIRRFARKECAGLTGEEWLIWLSAHDENKFNWQEKGKLLIQAPYAPMHQNFSVEQMNELIKAAKKWVR